LTLSQSRVGAAPRKGPIPYDGPGSPSAHCAAGLCRRGGRLEGGCHLPKKLVDGVRRRQDTNKTRPELRHHLLDLVLGWYGNRLSEALSILTIQEALVGLHVAIGRRTRNALPVQESCPATVAASPCKKVLQLIQVTPQCSARRLEFLATLLQRGMLFVVFGPEDDDLVSRNPLFFAAESWWLVPPIQYWWNQPSRRSAM
jgi:hypothetical protein